MHVPVQLGLDYLTSIVGENLNISTCTCTLVQGALECSSNTHKTWVKEYGGLNVGLSELGEMYEKAGINGKKVISKEVHTCNTQNQRSNW